MSSVIDSTPKPNDVTDFRFKKLRNVRIWDGGSPLEEQPHGPVNLLAISNKYGLVFATTKTEIRILRTVDIERLDEDRSLHATDASEYPFVSIELRERPWHLALSCDDRTFSVCVMRDSCPVAELYNLHALTSKGGDAEPYACIRLSSMTNVQVIDLKWNPEVPNMFAACTSDGCACTWSIEQNSIKICGCVAATPTPATSICWSPKGKQLVVGRLDGSLVQYLPTLQEAKTVPAPTIFENSVAVVNVTWLSSFQFAVTYLVDGRPNLVLVTSQKGKPCSYVNYDDICYGSSDLRRPQYYVVHLAELGILMCSSSNSIEVNLLAKTNSTANSAVATWEQWILEDSGRAELPLMSNEETYPLGMVLDFTSQRHILINETDLIPPKPILHILSTGGILCSYYAIGDKAGGPNLQRPPTEIAFDAARKSAATSSPNKTELNKVASESQEVSASVKLPFTSSPTGSTDHGGISRILTPSAGQQPSFGSIVSGKPASIGSAGSIISGTPVSGSGVNTELWKMPDNVSALSASQVANLQPPTLAREEHKKSNTTALPASTMAPNANASSSAAPLSPQKPSSPSKKGGPSQSVLIAAIKEELLRFGAEISSHRKSWTAVEPNLENQAAKESRSAIVSGVQELSEFVDEEKQAIRAINLDVHGLRGKALDTYGAVEEAISLERRTKDKHFLRLLRTRGLDPLSVKRMRDIRTFAYYLEQQMHDVHAVLDRQWEEHEALRQERSLIKRRNSIGAGGAAATTASGRSDDDLSKIDMIYKTVSANFNAMVLLDRKMDDMSARLSQIELTKRHQSKKQHPASCSGSLSKKIVKHEAIWSAGKKSIDSISVSPSDAQNLFASPKTKPSSTSRTTPFNLSSLRSFLEKRQVTHTRPRSPSETEFSRLLSPGPPSLNRTENGERGFEEEVDDKKPVISSTSTFDVETSKRDSQQQSQAAWTPTGPILSPRGPVCQQPSIFSVAAAAASSKASKVGSFQFVPYDDNDEDTGKTPSNYAGSSTVSNGIIISSSVNKPTAVIPVPATQSAAGFSFTYPTDNAYAAVAPSSAVHGFNFSKFAAASIFGGDSSVSSKMNSTGEGSIFASNFGSTKSASAAANATISSLAQPSQDSSKSILPDRRFQLDRTGVGKNNLNTGLLIEELVEDDEHRDREAEEEEQDQGQGAQDDDDDNDEDDDNDDEQEYDDEEEAEDEEEYADDDNDDAGDEDDDEEEDAELLIGQEQTLSDGGTTHASINLSNAAGVGATSSSALTVGDVGIAVPQMTTQISPVDVAKPAPVLASLISAKSPSATPDSALAPDQTFGTSPTGASQPAMPFTLSAGSRFTALCGPNAAAAAAATTVASSTPSSTTSSSVAPQSFRFVMPETATTTASGMATKLPTFSFKLTTTATTTAADGSGPAATSIFGQPIQATPSSTEASSPTSVSPATSTTTMTTTATISAPIFGGQVSSSLAQPGPQQTLTTESASSPFGVKFSFASSPSQPAGAASTPSIFGGTPLFGSQQPLANPPAAPQTFFGQSSSSAFSSNPTPVFGASPKVVSFGQPGSTVFSQPQQQVQTPTSSFGGVFGQSTTASGTGFFSGLGGKPNPANVNRNIFGGTTTFGNSSSGGASQSANIFGGGSSGSLWSKPATTGGSFQSSAGVGQTGFGGFQQTPSPTKAGGFGGSAAFGAPAAFGATPAFGGAPSFGALNQTGGRVFGSTSPGTAAQETSGFGSIAATTNAPSFGALATSASIGFGQPGSPGGVVGNGIAGTAQPSIFGMQTSTFGSPPVVGGSIFGGAAGSPATPNQSAFGSPGASPSFSQWRS